MKFSHLLVLAVAWADAAAASRCKPKSSVSPSSSPSAPVSPSSSPSPSVSPSSPSPSVSPSSSSSPAPSHSSSPSSSPSSSSSPVPSSPPSLSSSKTIPSSSSSVSSEAPSSCSHLANGDFSDGTSNWWISDQVTANSGTVHQGPAAGDYSFALIPSQTQQAGVWLNHMLQCTASSNTITVHIRFQFMFTGASSGCGIAANINNGASLLTIQQAGYTAGQWYTYSGPATQVQVYNNSPLFILQFACPSNTANQNAILVTDVMV